MQLKGNPYCNNFSNNNSQAVPMNHFQENVHFIHSLNHSLFTYFRLWHLMSGQQKIAFTTIREQQIIQCCKTNIMPERSGKKKNLFNQNPILIQLRFVATINQFRQICIQGFNINLQLFFSLLILQPTQEQSHTNMVNKTTPTILKARHTVQKMVNDNNYTNNGKETTANINMSKTEH